MQLHKFLEKFHKDQRGSSMMIALVAIAFIGILAAVVTTTTITNYKLRAMNASSKRTFYSAESAVEEIYSGLGDVCYTELKEAYVRTVTSLVDVDNNKANTNLRKFYLSNINGLCNWNNKEEIITYLNSFIQDTENAHVKSVDVVSNSSLPFVISNVVVEYRNSETDNFATVAVDLNIAYPNVNFDFIDDGGYLRAYVNYCMVGMEGIEVGSNSANVSASVQGGVFAGQGYKSTVADGGMTIQSGSVLTVNPGTAKTDTTYRSPSNLVIDGDLNVYGTMKVKDASAEVYDETRIWTENINVGSNSTQLSGNAGQLLYEGSSTNKEKISTYIQDDLNVYGDGSKVELSGFFAGNGISTESARNSSAIIINGTKANVDGSAVDYLVLGGTAFVSLQNKANNSDSVEFKTSDSVGIKGLQNLYLVPTAYMFDVNPVPYNDAAGEKVDTEALKEFFAYDLLNIDSDNGKLGYVVKTDGKANYYYLDFKPDVIIGSTSRSSSYTEYIYRIINMKSSADYGNVDYSQDEECIRLNAILKKNFDLYIDELNIPKESLQIDSFGNLYAGSGDNIKNYVMDGYNTWNLDGIAKPNHYITWNRYLTQKLYLYDTADTDEAYEQTRNDRYLETGDYIAITDSAMNKGATGSGNIVTTDYYMVDTSSNVYDYIIDTDQIKNLKKTYIRGINSDGSGDGADYFSIAVTRDTWGSDTLYLSSDKLKFTYTTTNALGQEINSEVSFGGVKKGVILAYDVDIIVDCDFTGCIVTNKKVYVKNNSKIIADAFVTDMVISKTNISGMFYAYQEKSTELKPEDIKTTDLLTTYNWRKNYIDGDM